MRGINIRQTVNSDYFLDMYLRDNTDDVAPRLWREFTDIWNESSDKTPAHQRHEQTYPARHM